MHEEILNELATWADTAPGVPFDSESMLELESIALDAIRKGDIACLARLRDVLSPVSAGLQERLRARDLDGVSIQASSIAALTRFVRMALFGIEKDDPEALVGAIRHARPILQVLLDGSGEGNLVEIQKRWPDPDAPSISTLSRAVAALEGGGMVQRLGVTRGRTVRLLPRGRAWIEGQRREDAKVVPFQLRPTVVTRPRTASGTDFRRKMGGRG